MKQKDINTLLVLFIIGVISALSARASGDSGTNKTEKILRVDVQQMSALVERDGTNGWKGLEIELLEHVAAELGFDSVEFNDIGDDFSTIFDGLLRGKADFAISGVTILSDRIEKVDFIPTIHSGLATLIRKDTTTLGSESSAKLEDLKIGALGLTVLLALIAGLTAKSWPRFRLLFSMTAIALAVPAVASLFSFYFVTQTEHLLAKAQRANFDLHGKRVATVVGTSSVGELQSQGATIEPTRTIEEAFLLLEQKKVQAVVFDSPVIWSYALGPNGSWCQVAGNTFAEQTYGIALPHNSPYRKAAFIAATKWLASAEGRDARSRYLGLAK